MSEFQQEGTITTIHGFYDLFDPREYLKRLENKLMAFSKHMNIGLLLPSLYSEMHVPGVLENIIDQINQVDYLKSIVVALGGTQIPSWNRVIYSVPDIYQDLVRVVEEENE